ncbi:sugar O-acetyltransferase [Alteromonas sp. MYP5]|uniref:Acetyltransferase n=1 Tax=Alteromonas ponticola TaxID=2720613 RepID=A0ABX1R0E5_9ALTE|nr:sugar O-acetyltransferase [Alteromonas ponticola]
MSIQAENPLRKLTFNPQHESFSAARARCKQLCRQFNLSAPYAMQEKKALLAELLNADMPIFIEADFNCEYGHNLHVGRQTFLNHNVTINDSAPVYIGQNVLIGPNCFLDTTLERTGNEITCAPIKIGNNVWVGANVIIQGGVEIGDNAIIGANCKINRSVSENAIIKVAQKNSAELPPQSEN